MAVVVFFKTSESPLILSIQIINLIGKEVCRRVSTGKEIFRFVIFLDPSAPFRDFSVPDDGISVLFPETPHPDSVF